MSIEPRSPLTAGFVAATVLAGSVALIAIFARPDADTVPSGDEGVRVVAAAAPARVASMPTLQPHSSEAEAGAQASEDVTTALIKRFPAIREAQIICESDCKLVAALGDQTLAPAPFGDDLERFLVARGYQLTGSLVLDQPGDNDTLLTIPLTLPSGARRIETGFAPLPANG